jgi:hexokinase
MGSLISLVIHNVHITPSDETPPWATELMRRIGVVIEKENQIMSAQTDALDQAEAAAASNSQAADSAEALLLTLAAMITDLRANTTDPATVTRIDALASALNNRASQLAAAVVAGTPAATV